MTNNSGTSSKKILAVVSSIPKGRVLTYQKVAQMAKIGNTRYVGFVLHRNTDPKRIPCHRVVRSNGTIAKGYAFGGKKVQEEKLKAEGVSFLSNGHIDLQKSLYKIS